MNEIRNSLLFEPINKAHSIAEVLVFVSFESVFNAESKDNFASLEQELNEAFPPFHPVGVTGNSFEINLCKTKTAEDWSVEWTITIAEKTIEIRCLDYPTWKEFWCMICGFLEKVLSKVVHNSISLLGLRYLDQFVYEGDSGEYDIKKLFNPNTTMISKHSFSTSRKWHCHSGWFSTILGNSQCLNQLNIDVASPINNQNKYIASIDHNAVFYLFGSSFDSTEIIEKLDSDISQVYNELHQINKDVLSEVLSPEMITLINL
jgi:uncharacterized protein (TIGR04255 family)